MTDRFGHEKQGASAGLPVTAGPAPTSAAAPPADAPDLHQAELMALTHSTLMTARHMDIPHPSHGRKEWRMLTIEHPFPPHPVPAGRGQHEWNVLQSSIDGLDRKTVRCTRDFTSVTYVVATLDVLRHAVDQSIRQAAPSRTSRTSGTPRYSSSLFRMIRTRSAVRSLATSAERVMTRCAVAAASSGSLASARATASHER